MDDLDAQELAQLGLKHLEDAVVALLSRHERGLPEAAIAERLGLAGPKDERSGVTAAILAYLVESGRIFWDEPGRLYRDNPEKI